MMSDIEITYIKDSIKELKEKMDIFSKQINDISITLSKNPFLECKDNFDMRYLQSEMFDSKWRESFEKHQTQNLNQTNNKVNLYKNIISIIQVITPYMILIYAVIK